MTAIVVGAGMGGLASAIVLAAAGIEVQVLELGDDVGGKADTQPLREGGPRFDTGPSLLTMPNVFEDLFDLTGATFSAYVDLLPCNSFLYRFDRGEDVIMSTTREETLGGVEEALGAPAAGEFARFLDYAQGIWDAAAPHFVYGDAPNEMSLRSVSPSMLRALARINAFDTMWGAITSRVKDPQLRWILARYATYNGSDPRTAPATLNCIAHVELAMGAYGVRGGIGALMQGLRKRAEELGVTFSFATRAERLEIDAGRVKGVVANGELRAADAVMWNADPALLGDPPALRERSTSGWTWVLRGARSNRRPSHAVLFGADYTQEFVDLFDRQRVPEDPAIYICDQGQSHDIVDGDSVPLFVMVNAPAGDEAPPPTQKVMRRLRSAGLDIDAAELVWQRGPADLARRFPGSAGAIYGLSSNSKLSAFRRPPNRSRKFGGLYLASGAAHPGGGLPLCALSGIAAARAAMSDLGIPNAGAWRISPR